MKICNILYIGLVLVSNVQASDAFNNLLGKKTITAESISQAGSIFNKRDVKGLSYPEMRHLIQCSTNTNQALDKIKEIYTDDSLRECLTGLIEEVRNDPRLKHYLIDHPNDIDHIRLLNRLMNSKGQNVSEVYEKAMSILIFCGPEFIMYTKINKEKIEQASKEGKLEDYVSTEKLRLNKIEALLQHEYDREEIY